MNTVDAFPDHRTTVTARSSAVGTSMHERFIKMTLVACAVGGLVLSAPTQAQQRDIMLVLDNSGSMKKNDLDFLTAVAVKTFIRNLAGDTHLGILVFDEKVDLVVPLSALDVGSRARFLDGLAAIDFRGQWTHSSAALERALYELRNDGRPLAEKSIVFMTDGIVDTGDAARDVERTRWIQTELAASAAASGVRVFGIAFTDNADFQLIQSLAHRSGGEYYRAYKATDIERVFDSIDNALRSPLEIGAVPGLEAPAGTPATGAVPELLAAPSLSPTPVSEPATLVAAELPAVPEAPSLPQPGAEPLPSLTPPSPAVVEPATVPKPTLPQAGVNPSDAGSNGGASFLAELGAPVVVPQAGDPVAATITPENDSATAAAPAPVGGVEPASAPVVFAPTGADTGVPLAWLLAGGGGLAVLAGAGLFLVLRQRRKRVPPSTVPKAFLNDLGGATDRSSHELGALPTVIGRLQGPDGDGHHYIVIDESTIGRRHAIVDYTEHAYWVADQNSLNGTFVNGQRIKDRTRLKHGDRIRFHGKEFEFVLWEMFETDRTEMSQTLFSTMLEDDVTQMDDDSRDHRRASSPRTIVR